jgi:hypothetical protein
MRAFVGLALVIVFVWITMLAGLVVIFASLPFLISTLSVRIGRLLESVMVAGIGAVMVLVWLAIWKELAFRYFLSLLSRRETADSS